VQFTTVKEYECYESYRSDFLAKMTDPRMQIQIKAKFSKCVPQLSFKSEVSNYFRSRATLSLYLCLAGRISVEISRFKIALHGPNVALSCFTARSGYFEVKSINLTSESEIEDLKLFNKLCFGFKSRSQFFLKNFSLKKD
jgi:hypothetical protein